MNTINGRTPEEIKRSLKCRAMWGTPDCKMKCDECGTYVPGLNGSIMAAAAIALIQQLESAQPKWISVEERLPEPYKKVLTIREGFSETGRYIYSLDSTTLWIDNTLVWNGDLKTWKNRVTHWMPLPEPPK